jgi:farnesol dehydrogenase
MKIFLTGATGFIGANLALKLANAGNTVHALYRSEEKAKDIQQKNIKLFKGDITDIESIRAAMQDCQQVYHIAAFTDVWAKNPELIYELNVTATDNVLKTALELGVEKVVFTSTAGVFGPSINGTINESTERAVDYFLEYERSKAIAETLAKEYVQKRLDVVIVNPTRVYGPGKLNKSNSVTIMIQSYIAGKWRVIPGNGKSVGNYVFIDDVVNGHLLAMKSGKPGERYILGGSNISYIDFFNILREISGQKHFMFKLPLTIMLTVSHFMMLLTRLFGIKPMITPALVRKFNYHWNVSSKKAEKELGYQITDFKKGAEKTINWLRNISKSLD